MKEPSAPETVCWDAPERSLASVTVTPGRAAPAGSTTLPRICPAQTADGRASTKKAQPSRALPTNRFGTFIEPPRKGQAFPLAALKAIQENVSFVSPARKSAQ